jgi:HEAT repeat protein/energy-coupling factor transporter ATP-binding protein EcfA2
MDTYRQKVIETYNKLVLTGLPERDPRLHEIRLDNIFVKLTIAVEDSFKTVRYLKPPEFDKADLEEAKYFRQREEKVQSKPMTIAAALQKYRYLLITGAPGSGKTTLLRWLAVTFADRRQAENLGEAFSEEAVPILLELRRFSKRFHRLSEQPTAFDLAEEISAFVGDDPRFHGVSADWMRQTLAQQPCLLLIDGLDEIADQMTRQRLLEAVEAFVQIPIYAKVRCLLTTRPHGFQDVSLGAKFQKTEVQAFTSDDIAAFIRHWYETAYAEEYQAEASELITAIREQDRVTELAKNPLLCTIIAIIYRNKRVLPNRRVRLYLECCEALLDTWERNKTELVEQSPLIGRFDWEIKLELLMPIAYRFHAQEQKLALPEAEVVKWLAEALAEFDLSHGLAAEQEARQFIVAIRDRSGILQGRGDGTLEFSHRTFQEYLAARYIAKQDDPIYIDLVMKHLHEAWWREVHLLVIGHLGCSDTAWKAEKLMLTILRVYKKPNALLLPYKWFNFINLGKLFPRLQWRRRIAWHTLREFELVAQGYADCTVPAKTKKLSQTLSEFIFKQFLNWQRNPFYSKQQNFLITTAAKQNLSRDKIVAIFLRGLLDKQWNVRYAAANSLGKLGQASDKVIDALLKALLDKHGYVRGAAANSLGKLGKTSDQVIDVLLKALLDKEEYVQGAAANSLAQLGQASEKVIDALLNALFDKNEYVQNVVANSLAQLDKTSEKVIDVLVKALDENEYVYVRCAAAESLVQLGQASDKVIDVLVKALFDKQWYVRRAAYSLGQSGQASDKVIDALIKVLLDKDGEVRRTAAYSLGKLGQASEKVIDALLNALLGKDEEVRRAAADSLGKLAQTSNKVIDALLKALLDKDEDVRSFAAANLGKLGQANAQVIDALLKTLLDKHEDVRGAAANSLGELGQASAQVIDALLNALLDKNEYVRRVAAESLGQLGQPSEKVIDALVKALLDKNEDVRSAAADSLLDKLKIEDEKIIKQVLICLNRDLHDDDENVCHIAFESLRKHLNGRKIPGYRWKPLQNNRKKQKLRIISLSSILLLLILLVLTLKTPIIPNTMGIILTLIVGGIQLAIWFKEWFKGDEA